MPVKLLDRLRWSRPVSNETETETGKNVDSDAPPRDAEKDEKEKDVDEGVKPLEDDSDGDTSAAQQGIKDVEAMTHVWTRGHLIAAYVLIWLITFIDAMQQNMSSSLTAYVTSSFSAHSLTSVTGIVANLIGGISKIPLAKILDLWGRPHGFALMVVILTLGLIMMAGCNNVQTYCAAQVFYWVG
ncbi:MFS siderochrome iron transporter 1, partial [Ascosphaera atra]